MAKNVFHELADTIDRNSHEIAGYVVDRLQPYVQKSLDSAIAEYYSYPEGSMYNRTGNFRNWKASVTKENGDWAVINLSNDEMSPYPGMWGQELTQEGSMELMFQGGMHGYGEYCIGVMPSPFSLVQKDADTGFNGAVTDLIYEAASKILLKGFK